MKKNFSLLFVGLLLTSLQIRANNIVLANVALNGQNTGSQNSLINFDVSWENSWRTITNEANYDGAWIFAKFRKKSSSLWQHATINATGGTVPASSVLQVSLDGKGVWIYQALPPLADFTGNVNYTGAKIRWNYGVDGVLNTDSVEIRVFAVEMVYVPGGPYKLGTGGAESNHFYNATTNNPYDVTSEGPITVGLTLGNLSYPAGGLSGDQGGPIPAGFPKGFNAFWIMKYEASQQQYVDFLNNLDLARATNRNPNYFTGTHPNLVAPQPERELSNMAILDYLAWADWACLRPFTELEYEKACRGYNQVPVPNEYPWGNTTILPTTTVTNPGTANELANNGNANYNTNGTPLRCGIYATGVSTRQSSGGTFYGVMDMAGGEYETVISVGSAAGRAFTNVNGDGSLDLNGDANVAAWPAISSGYGLRGGSYADVPARLTTSDRATGFYNGVISSRPGTLGIRVARTAE